MIILVFFQACVCLCALTRVSFLGVPVSSRVSAKIQQLVNTLKQPRRPPLREFFVDDFEELLEGKSLSQHNSFFGAFLINKQIETYTITDLQTNHSFESFLLIFDQSINRIN